MRCSPSLLLSLSLVACGPSDKPASGSGDTSGTAGPTTQTAREAMTLVCGAFERSGARVRPPDEQARVMTAWMRDQVTNPDIRRVLDELSLDTWPSANARLVSLAAQHGVTPCALVASIARPSLPVELPALSGPSEPDDPSRPLVVIGRTSITLASSSTRSLTGASTGAPTGASTGAGPSEGAGASIVSLEDGVIAVRALENGRIASLAERVAAVAPGARVRLAFDRRTPMATAVAVIASFVAGGRASVDLVGEQNGESRLVPLEMTAGAAGVSYAVVAKPDGLALWTVARGKLGEQRVTASLDGGVGQILRELVKLASKAGGGAPKIAVALVLDPALDVERLVQLVAALRLTSSPVLVRRLD